ncbi:MAG: thiamine-phosphate kinase, partial [Rhodospirillaceae bacterium]
MARAGEFSLIDSLFRPLAASASGALDLRDDAALVRVPEGQELTVSCDTLVSGVHFLPKDPPDLVARKCLRVNLSDMAAMGAEPKGVLLSAQLAPDVTTDWLERFADGLGQDLKTFGIGLYGGDTVATPGPTAFSVTIFGHVTQGTALRRSGAKVGQGIWVSGSLGDAAFGLIVLRDGLLGLEHEHQNFLADRYRLPRPRVDLGLGLRGIASACMDVSDGLVADLTHLAKASGVQAVISAPSLPMSDAVAALVADDLDRLESVFAGGDDYELLFCADDAPKIQDMLKALAQETQTPLCRIGQMRPLPAMAKQGDGVLGTAASSEPT